MNATEKEKAFLGIGWAFPIKLEADGVIETVSYEEDVRQSILIILQTEPGERIMRPDFGSGLRTYVFEPINTSTMALIKTRVEETLIKWEPRIDLEEVTVTQDKTQLNKLVIDIKYRVRTTNSLYNLVYPFYLDEGAVQ